MNTLKNFKRDLLADPAGSVEFKAPSCEFAMARELFAARSRPGLTQGEIVQRMGTKQSVIARPEGGKRKQSMRTVQSYAKATGCRAMVRLEPRAG